jgi:hypothetical protein
MMKEMIKFNIVIIYEDDDGDGEESWNLFG